MVIEDVIIVGGGPCGMAAAISLKEIGINLIHDIEEEEWGQLTIRFLDPDGNIIEVGESMPCFCRRLSRSGLSVSEVARKTGIPIESVEGYLR
jgi:2-polyprenyl-6-methoxyphenol hydroxylase-like FAD-dependent oxidoreductase